MTDAERLAAIKVSLIRVMTVRRELIDRVENEDPTEFFNPDDASGGNFDDCFRQGGDYGRGSECEDLLHEFFPKEE